MKPRDFLNFFKTKSGKLVAFAVLFAAALIVFTSITWQARAQRARAAAISVHPSPRRPLRLVCGCLPHLPLPRAARRASCSQTAAQLQPAAAKLQPAAAQLRGRARSSGPVHRSSLPVERWRSTRLGSNSEAQPLPGGAAARCGRGRV